MAWDAHTVDTAADLRARMGDTHPMMLDKSMDHIDERIRRLEAMASERP